MEYEGDKALHIHLLQGFILKLRTLWNALPLIYLFYHTIVMVYGFSLYHQENFISSSPRHLQGWLDLMVEVVRR